MGTTETMARSSTRQGRGRTMAHALGAGTWWAQASIWTEEKCFSRE